MLPCPGPPLCLLDQDFSYIQKAVPGAGAVPSFQSPERIYFPTVMPKVQPSSATSATGMRSSGPLLAKEGSFLLGIWTTLVVLITPLSPVDGSFSMESVDRVNI